MFFLRKSAVGAVEHIDEGVNTMGKDGECFRDLQLCLAFLSVSVKQTRSVDYVQCAITKLEGKTRETVNMTLLDLFSEDVIQ